MRINPISHNYGRKLNIQQIETNLEPIKQPVFEGVKQTKPSTWQKIGCYTFAILAAPFILIGFLGDALTACLTGESTPKTEK